MAMPLVVREVYQHNLEFEFNLIRRSLWRFPYISMDTEFPGTVYPDGVPAHLRGTVSPAASYANMKRNVDALNLIQVGLTLFDARGSVPTLGTPFQYVWEFNFRDFDPETDLHNPDSISLLERQGIDFSKNKRLGIDSRYFASLLWDFRRYCGRVTWVTFHGTYDFGFLIKILTRRDLPEDVNDFLMLVKAFFGPMVYDVKNMIRFFGLHGGLERVAKSLNLPRLGGRSHQAGSDSLLTMAVFLTLRRMASETRMKTSVGQMNNAIYGLASTTVN